MARGLSSSTVASFLLIFFGAVLVAQPFLNFTTAVVDTTPPQPSSGLSLLVCYPTFDSPTDSTSLPMSSSTPGILYPGQSCQLVQIIYEDNPDTATITIAESGGSTLVSSASMTVHSTASPNIVRYVYSWTVPNTSDKLYVFTVTAIDKAGNSATWNYYGKTTGQVQGYFVINGVKITGKDDVIYLRTKTLNVEFYATSGASAIQYVHVTVKNANTGAYVGGFDANGNPIYMTKGTDKWTYSVTVPSDGRYIVTGTVYPTGASSITLMSVAIDTGFASPLSVQTILGGLLILFGLVLYARSRRE